MELLGIEMPFEEFDRLMVEQSEGKDLKVDDGKVVAVEHQITNGELKSSRIYVINNRLNSLSQDFIQTILGAEISDLKQRKEEFIELHNELRQLIGKEKRNYK